MRISIIDSVAIPIYRHIGFSQCSGVVLAVDVRCGVNADVWCYQIVGEAVLCIFDESSFCDQFGITNLRLIQGALW